MDEYVGSLSEQILWGLMSAAFVGLLVWVRVIRPRRALSRPWRVARVTPERGQTTTVALDPPPGVDFGFRHDVRPVVLFYADRAALIALDVPPERVHTERFGMV